MDPINPQHFTGALKTLLHETFDRAGGLYLDHGTSLFETLAGIDAATASIPVGGRCGTLAAQVKHTAFFFDDTIASVTDPDKPPADWDEIWRTVSAVSEAEWEAILGELRDSYDRILAFIDAAPGWPGEDDLAGGMTVVVHSAYHLGEIRQALCSLIR
ncbi:MAG TPA: hypothetical protein VMN57_06500 [Anaerolineales bacterium]|nr:hypothetical protein [Anaerolineales bacterium]